LLEQVVVVVVLMAVMPAAVAAVLETVPPVAEPVDRDQVILDPVVVVVDIHLTVRAATVVQESLSLDTLPDK
jgi:hypothetical protein